MSPAKERERKMRILHHSKPMILDDLGSYCTALFGAATKNDMELHRFSLLHLFIVISRKEKA